MMPSWRNVHEHTNTPWNWINSTFASPATGFGFFIGPGGSGEGVRSFLFLIMLGPGHNKAEATAGWSLPNPMGGKWKFRIKDDQSDSTRKLKIKPSERKRINITSYHVSIYNSTHCELGDSASLRVVIASIFSSSKKAQLTSKKLKGQWLPTLATWC